MYINPRNRFKNRRQVMNIKYSEEIKTEIRKLNFPIGVHLCDLIDCVNSLLTLFDIEKDDHRKEKIISILRISTELIYNYAKEYDLFNL